MRQLMLLRHSKAVPADGRIDDSMRPLSPRGRRDAQEIGAYMARHRLTPDGVVCSPSKRTRETWDIVAPALGKPPAVAYDKRLYEATPETILDVIRKNGGEAQRFLIIGHNPGLHKAAVSLIAAGEVDLRERLQESLPTSGLVLIEFAFETWDQLHPRAGRLELFVTPESLKEPTD
ncbi:MAG TPA: histidine phosphatase family protein [Xanthobacteraceae bacterium]|nr:histidine phosphatase family protein [Xanthobacteraceae bacterium]